MPETVQSQQSRTYNVGWASGCPRSIAASSSVPSAHIRLAAPWAFDPSTGNRQALVMWEANMLLPDQYHPACKPCGSIVDISDWMTGSTVIMYGQFLRGTPVERRVWEWSEDERDISDKQAHTGLCAFHIYGERMPSEKSFNSFSVSSMLKERWSWRLSVQTMLNPLIWSRFKTLKFRANVGIFGKESDLGNIE